MPCHAAMCEESHPMSRRDHFLRYLALHIPTVVLRESFTILVLGFLGLAGGVIALGLVPFPAAITITLGTGPLAWAWAAGLTVGSVLGLAGLLRRLWWLESGALWLLVTALVVHLVGSLQVFGTGVIIQVAFTGALALAAGIRAVALAAVNAVSGFRLDHDAEGSHDH